MRPVTYECSILFGADDCFLLCTAQVAINMPLKSNTRDLFNSATLNKMKKGAVLVCDFGSFFCYFVALHIIAAVQHRNASLCPQTVVQSMYIHQETFLWRRSTMPPAALWTAMPSSMPSTPSS